jgi:CO dehydrogenase/acetyl-CoA synthase gamma subunit (corrinoid Fe-S protein)
LAYFTGICVFDLGGNDYLIRAELNGFWKEENITVIENDNTNFVELRLLPLSEAITEITYYRIGEILMVAVISIVLVSYAIRRKTLIKFLKTPS